MKICPLCHNEMKLFPGEWQPLYFCPNEACRFFTEKLTVKAISFLNEHLTRQSAIIVAQAEVIEAARDMMHLCAIYNTSGVIDKGAEDLSAALQRLEEVQNENA